MDVASNVVAPGSTRLPTDVARCFPREEGDVRTVHSESRGRGLLEEFDCRMLRLGTT